MKIILSSKEVRVIENTLDKLPLMVREKYNLLNSENDKVYLIQVCIGRNDWVTKKIIFREYYKNFFKKIVTMNEKESDESMLYRAEEEYYKYIKKL